MKNTKTRLTGQGQGTRNRLDRRNRKQELDRLTYTHKARI